MSYEVALSYEHQRKTCEQQYTPADTSVTVIAVVEVLELEGKQGNKKKVDTLNGNKSYNEFLERSPLPSSEDRSLKPAGSLRDDADCSKTCSSLLQAKTNENCGFARQQNMIKDFDSLNHDISRKRILENSETQQSNSNLNDLPHNIGDNGFITDDSDRDENRAKSKSINHTADMSCYNVCCANGPDPRWYYPWDKGVGKLACLCCMWCCICIIFPHSLNLPYMRNVMCNTEQGTWDGTCVGECCCDIPRTAAGRERKKEQEYIDND